MSSCNPVIHPCKPVMCSCNPVIHPCNPVMCSCNFVILEVRVITANGLLGNVVALAYPQHQYKLATNSFLLCQNETALCTPGKRVWKSLKILQTNHTKFQNQLWVLALTFLQVAKKRKEAEAREAAARKTERAAQVHQKWVSQKKAECLAKREAEHKDRSTKKQREDQVFYLPSTCFFPQFKVSVRGH